MTKIKSNKTSSIWGGRFEDQPEDLMQQINQSISFDYKLYRQDIKGSIAHARMLNKIEILNKDELEKIISGLKQIEKEIENNEFDFKIELEDIHMNIETRLKEIIGDIGGKLHTARSRNDQVATDIKLFVRDEIDVILSLLEDFRQNLIKKAEENIDVIMPGFTHLQVAQPVLFSHHLLAYNEMVKRDISRLKDCRQRLNQCPLGAAALAGTSFAIDRFMVASELGFDEPTANSMDSVSDRDFIIEYLAALSIIAVHLSRLAEEIIIWMSKGFEFITLPDSFTSGSSIMPQKRNPDAAELIRGKSGRIFGSLLSLLTTMKGLSLTYSKDMQEDKEPLFDATQNIKICIEAMSKMTKTLKTIPENMLKMADSQYSTATDLADWLVKNLQLPFRNCHHIAGQIVKFAEKSRIKLAEIAIDDLKKIEPRITEEIYNVLSVENSVNSRDSYGGTSIKRVRETLKNEAKK